MPRFLMTYPCYVVLRANGWPDTVKTPIGRAIALFTDEDLAERYCRAKRQAVREQLRQDVREFDLLGFEHAEGLIAALHKNAAALAEQGIKFVAVDPSPEKRVVQIVTDEEFRRLSLRS